MQRLGVANFYQPMAKSGNIRGEFTQRYVNGPTKRVVHIDSRVPSNLANLKQQPR